MRKAFREVGFGAASAFLIVLVVLVGSIEVVEMAVFALSVGLAIWVIGARRERLQRPEGGVRRAPVVVAAVGAAVAAGVFVQIGHFMVLFAAVALAVVAVAWVVRALGNDLSDDPRPSSGSV